MEIYLSRNGQQFGPYTAEWLESFLAEGTVSAEDLAWTAGREGWVPLRVLLAELRPAPVVEVAPEPVREPAPEPAPEPVIEVQAPQVDVPMELGLLPEIADAVRARPGLQSRISLRGVAAVAVGIVLFVGLVLVMNVPKHASIKRNGEHWLLPDNGYTFVDANDPFNWQVQWTPGKPSTAQASVLAGTEPDTWQLAPGYELPPAGAGTLDPIWTPGKRDVAWPHVAAGDDTSKWIPDPGYEMTGSPTAPAVTWRAGVRLPHMTSADRENHWDMDAGYWMAPGATSENPHAAWTPGKRRSDNAHVYAAAEEGRWRADAGYVWLNDAADDYRTFSPARTAEAWRDATSIDSGIRDLDCTSGSAVLAVVKDARDRYNQIDVSEVHPVVVQHFTAVRDTLDSGATTLETCFVVRHGPAGIDITAAAICLFSRKSGQTWQQCMDESSTFREIVGAVGEVGTAACESSMANFWMKRDELASDRRELQRNFRSAFRMELATLPQMVTCR